MTEFVHLHVHTEFSLLDGLAKIGPLMARARELGMQALAITDHGTMYGVIQFYKHAQRHGLKPTIGCELYVAQRHRTQRVHGEDSKPYHLTVLVRNETGYKNLMKLVTKAQLEGFYYKPRVDRELLEEYSDGLIVLSGCPTAEIPRLIRNGKVQEARELAGCGRGSRRWNRCIADGTERAENTQVGVTDSLVQMIGAILSQVAQAG